MRVFLSLACIQSSFLTSLKLSHSDDIGNWSMRPFLGGRGSRKVPRYGMEFIYGIISGGGGGRGWQLTDLMENVIKKDFHQKVCVMYQKEIKGQ